MYDRQLEWIQALHQALRGPIVDEIFYAWAFVDTAYFVVLVTILVRYLWNKEFGARVGYLFLLSSAVNVVLKSVLGQPRPCQVDPAVGLICGLSGGMPSGGAQSAMLYFGLACIECKRALWKWLVGIFALILCFSRVYLGMHYFSDIAGGLAVGGLLLIVYVRAFPKARPFWKPLAFFLPLVLCAIGFGFPRVYELAALSLGFGVGILFERRWRSPWLVFPSLIGMALIFVANHFLPELRLLWNFSGGIAVTIFGGRQFAKSQ